uniref:Uncharacterized protein n=2 Tax=Aegilops tauschii subsp. strangulata TaxID=200361 RepID=A0A453ART4_AEGTS
AGVGAQAFVPRQRRRAHLPQLRAVVGTLRGVPRLGLIARLTLGQVEVPPALWAASWVSICFLMLLGPVAWFLAGARSSRSPYTTTDANKDLMGILVPGAFILLAIDYDKVVGLLGVEGSQRERIGSTVRDLGLMGAGATCLVTLTTMILRQWRMK